MKERQSWIGVCVYVASRSPYITDLITFRWVRGKTASFRVFQGGVGTKRARRSENLSFIASTGCLCEALSTLWTILCHSACGFGESASGSQCDEVRRRDMVTQQFQPKGHICSLSFALHICLHLSSIIILLSIYFSVYALNMYKMSLTLFTNHIT